jgi:ketosteroid isomerase-like protein
VTAGSETVQVDSTGPREWAPLLSGDTTLPRALKLFAIADSAFATAAAGNHAAEAFGKWAAPDAVTFAGDGTLNIGAAKIRAAVAAGGDGEWRWAPVFTFTSQGNYGKHQIALGYTIGQAVITARDASGKTNTFKSKYLTFWKTNPDGTVRFTADGGSGRP